MDSQSRKEIRGMKIYDSDFGKQPAALELQVGSAFPSLSEETECCRKKFSDELGLPLPPIKISANAKLKPCECAILLHGVEVEKAESPDLDCGAVREKLEDVVKRNITSFLNQRIVNELLLKVRADNPDVVDDVMFNQKFRVSDLKTILNWLLAEYVPICDMSAIMETIADLGAPNWLVPVFEKIRERLSLSILKKYADKDRKVRVVALSPDISELLLNHFVQTNSNIELPYFHLDIEDDCALKNAMWKKIKAVKEKGRFPVFICPKAVRTIFTNHSWRRFERSDFACVSHEEFECAKPYFRMSIEGVLRLDEK